MPEPKKLLDVVRDVLRTKHYSYRTEQTYVDWIKRYILFHQKRRPKDMGAEEIQAFITHLATERKVTASTQNQALSAILFLYRIVLQKEINLPPELVRASRPKILPTVLTHAEAMAVINKMRSTSRLMTKILYGSGLRLMECLRMRVKDIDFGNHQIIVRASKGEDDRFTILPDSIVSELHLYLRKCRQTHLQDIKALYDKDLQEGYGKRPCPMRSTSNTPTPGGNGPGSSSSRSIASHKTRAAVSYAAIISIPASWSKRSKRQRRWLRLRNPSARIPFATVLPPTYWKMAMTPSTCGLGRCSHNTRTVGT